MARAFSVKKHIRTDRGGQVVWKVSGRAPGGRQVRRYFSTKEEAEVFAFDANGEVRSVGWQAMGLSDEARVESAKCLEMLAPSGRTLTEAVKFYLKHLAETERSITVSAAVDELMQFKAGKGLSARHAINLRYFFKPLVTQFGERKVSTLTRREIEAWLNSRKLHPVSYKSTLRHLSILFNHCIQMGTASVNPVKDIRAPKAATEDVGILTPAAMRELLTLTRELHPDILAAVALQGFAGLRRSEVCRLDWVDVDLGDGSITLRGAKSKTGTRRVIPISANLSAWLLSVRCQSGSVAPKCFNGCFTEIHRALVAKKHAFPKNALRHSFASYRLAETQNANQTALESGNSVPVLNESYKGLVKAKDVSAWWAILPTDISDGNVIAMPTAAMSTTNRSKKVVKG